MSTINHSLWVETCSAAFESNVIEPNAHYSVIVVGAGILGLSTALHLSELGIDVAVIEAETVGYGGSGRNGGQVIPGLKFDPDVLDEMFGEDTTQIVGEASNYTFDLIKKYQLECNATQKGWVQATAKHAHLDMISKRAEQWRKRGIDSHVLSNSEMQSNLGSSFFCGGWKDPRGGTINPLSYCLELASAAQKKGVKIVENSRITAWDKGTKNRLTINSGASVTADFVVFCTNAYSDDLVKNLKKTIVPAHSFQIASEPLSELQLKSILPTGVSVSDTRRIACYFRLSPDNRLMLGGRGFFKEPESLSDFKTQYNMVSDIFPELNDLSFTHHWFGRVAMTRDHLPHIYQPTENSLSMLGYNGRGVALSTRIGLAVAEFIDHKRPLPLQISKIRPLPLHSLHPFYASFVIHYYRFRDMMEN